MPAVGGSTAALRPWRAAARGLEIGGWLPGKALDADSRRAFDAIGKLPRLTWLSVAGCTALRVADFTSWKGAPLDTIDLTGVAGNGAGRIAPDDLAPLWYLFPRFQTLIYED